MTPEQLAQIHERHLAAHQEVNRLCQPDSKWRMSIPVRDGDSDRLIAASLDDIPALLAHAAQVEAERDALVRDRISISMNEATGEITVTSANGDYGTERIVATLFSSMLATILSANNGGEHWGAKVRMIPDHDAPLPFD